MKKKSLSNCPSLYIQGQNEQSSVIALKLTRARQRFVVRFTGGCGYMSVDDANGLYDLFARAFNGFSGAILFGGTRMVNREDFDSFLPSITEIPALIKKNNPAAVILGVVPKTSEVKLSEAGMIVSNESENDYITIVHPDQDMCLIVQKSVDNTVSWEAEYKECLSIIKSLKDFAGWDSLLISYNGGLVTEKEILETAELGWPVLLINDSGRITEKYANDKIFLKRYPNVFVAEKHSASIQKKLQKLMP